MPAIIPQQRRDMQSATLLRVFGLLLLLAIPPWFMLAAVVQFSPAVELKSRQAMERHGMPAWEYVAHLGDKVWREPRPATFATLNDGRWTKLCVNGGFTDPVATFENAFGPSKIADEVRALYDRLVPVGEYDVAVSYADQSGWVEVLYVIAGGSLQAINLIRCMRRDG